MKIKRRPILPLRWMGSHRSWHFVYNLVPTGCGSLPTAALCSPGFPFGLWVPDLASPNLSSLILWVSPELTTLAALCCPQLPPAENHHAALVGPSLPWALAFYRQPVHLLRSKSPLYQFLFSWSSWEKQTELIVALCNTKLKKPPV